ncbi:LPS-assembly protein LptD [Dissulfurirhabdus thermomarina]|uniref:LPS-assembly protein LptD n=1 Tax=Dissulfurirhabdus thermomarina TaxID=1765737 RepID=A0A6N9TJJ8_DISTH|nr:LPS assembly protein LptD [Dissulfurirhabdus thermomarina]NDY41432.1 LPS-assembly protein LptD [Dissulfurirhabdus thermomarina]NMX24420.1 LPS-assembly protein LptD [Dissulfurirhabdus thermomarina]
MARSSSAAHWFAALAWAVAVLAAGTAAGAAVPWRVEADRITYHADGDLVVAEGHVRASRGGMTCEADTVAYDRRRSRLQAWGNVTLRTGGDVLRGSRADLDLATATGTVEDAELFLSRNNVTLAARTIRRTGEDEYEVEDAVVTTCPVPRSAWSFRCRRLRVRASGLAVAAHTTFRVKDVPVLYAPLAAWPVNQERETGFLTPYYTSSSRNGFELELPFFWALGDSFDATFSPRYLANRGMLLGGEFRYALSPASLGVIRYSYLHDNLVDDDFDGDGQVRGNARRWWVRAKADQDLPLGVAAKLDVDLVSDRDYFEEFREGPMGFGATNRMFRKWFNRSLNDETDVIRLSTFQLARTWEDHFWGAEARFHQNLLEDAQDETLQTLPRVAVEGFRRRLWRTPLYYDWRAEYVNYWRERGLESQRLDLAPRLALPVDFGGVADFLVSATARETLYRIGGDCQGWATDLDRNRFTHELAADLGTTLGRTFDLGGGRFVRHTLRPVLSYRYRPPKDVDGLPGIDAVDRLGQENLLVLSLLNFVTTRRDRPGGRFTYRDPLVLRLEEGFDVRESRRRLGPGEKRRPFTDLLAELELNPNEFVTLRSDTTFGVYGQGVTTHRTQATFRSPAGDRLGLTYRYHRAKRIHTLDAVLDAVLTPAWTLTLRTQRSLEEPWEELRSSYGFRYKAGCWSLEFRVDHTPDEDSFVFYIDLAGLGGWGTR